MSEIFTELFLPDENQEPPLWNLADEWAVPKIDPTTWKHKTSLWQWITIGSFGRPAGVFNNLLSKVINKNPGKNFNQFVNDYRLQEAKGCF